MEKEFHKLVVHFALETKAVHQELFIFPSDADRKNAIVQPIHSIVSSTLLRCRGDVTKVLDPISHSLVYKDEESLYQ